MAIQRAVGRPTTPGLLRFARNDDRDSTHTQFGLSPAPALLELNPHERALAAARGRQPIGSRGEADRLVELARKSRLVRITAFERQFA